MQRLCGEFGATLADLKGFEKGSKSIDPLHEESLEFASNLPPTLPSPSEDNETAAEAIPAPRGVF